MTYIGDAPAIVDAARRLLFDHRTGSVAASLSSAGIDTLVLKGPSTVRRLYLPEGRAYGDIDLLVAPRQMVAARSHLLSIGFEPPVSLAEDRPAEAESWFRRADGTNLDLHRSLAGIRAGDAETWQVLWAHREEMELRGMRVLVLDEPAWCMHLALHAAQHGPNYPVPLADLDAAIRSRGSRCWMEAAEIARRLDATQAMAAGLDLVDGGSDLSATLRLPLLRDSDVMLRASGASSEMMFLNWWREQPFGVKVSSLARKVFPPREYLMDWSPSACRGIGGLVLAYVGRPFWLLWRGVRAAIALSSRRT